MQLRRASFQLDQHDRSFYFKLMRERQTKTRLLKIGLDQLSVHGLQGLTLGRLATTCGVSKSGLFAHFQSKEQLQIELLEEAERVAASIVVEPAMLAEAGLPRLRAIMTHWLGWTRRAGLSGGCPLSAIFFELDDIESEVRSHAVRLAKEWLERLGGLVRNAKDLMQMSEDADVEQIVWELCSIYLAHHVSSRFLRSLDADQRARISFDALIERHRSKPAALASQTPSNSHKR